MSTWTPDCALCIAFRDRDAPARTQFRGVPVCERHAREIADFPDSKASRKLREYLRGIDGN